MRRASRQAHDQVFQRESRLERAVTSAALDFEKAATKEKRRDYYFACLASRQASSALCDCAGGAACGTS